MSTIQIQNVTKEYKDGDTSFLALKPTSFTLHDHDFGIILGPSGSGKSTLLTILGALQNPTTGKVIIDQTDIFSLSKKELSDFRFKNIGFLLQGSNLIPYLTLDEQLEFRYRYAKQDPHQKEALIKKFKLETLRNKYPNEMSGGQRQRAALACMLTQDPALILADEPTASLDKERAIEVVSLLKELALADQRTIVMVSHDRRMIPYCNRIFAMEDGIFHEQ